MARVRREQRVCWLCGGEIDLELKWPHPYSFSVDHVESAKYRPDLALVYSNLRAAHLTHNRKRGTGRGVVKPSGRPSREW